jgi:hypothetical protein
LGCPLGKREECSGKKVALHELMSCWAIGLVTRVREVRRGLEESREQQGECSKEWSEVRIEVVEGCS